MEEACEDDVSCDESVFGGCAVDVSLTSCVSDMFDFVSKCLLWLRRFHLYFFVLRQSRKTTRKHMAGWHIRGLIAIDCYILYAEII